MQVTLCAAQEGSADDCSGHRMRLLPLKKVESCSIDIKGYSVDWLVKRGVEHIINTGEEISSRAGDALQSYNVNYILLNSRNRIHTLRPRAARYFARELIAYFNGSLRVDEGLSQASAFWKNLADEHGCINSNYGHYVFHAPLHGRPGERNQYEWVVNRLKENAQSRRAMININQAFHKSDTKDFPCTIGMVFFIRDGQLINEVYSRSTDIITGLPYDMGFFSLVTELVYADLVQTAYPALQLGYTSMKTTFTQLYLRHFAKAEGILKNRFCDDAVEMPRIRDAKAVLQDIYDGTRKTDIMQWIDATAELPHDHNGTDDVESGQARGARKGAREIRTGC